LYQGNNSQSGKRANTPKFKTPKKQESLVKDPISQSLIIKETIANLVKEPMSQSIPKKQ
jgi:hypothetical protein